MGDNKIETISRDATFRCATPEGDSAEYTFPITITKMEGEPPASTEARFLMKAIAKNFLWNGCYEHKFSAFSNTELSLRKAMFRGH